METNGYQKTGQEGINSDLGINIYVLLYKIDNQQVPTV